MSALGKVKVNISVVIGGATMPIRQLLKMGRGAVVDLDSAIGAPVRILANDECVARGEIVLLGDRVAVSVTQVIPSPA